MKQIKHFIFILSLSFILLACKNDEQIIPPGSNPTKKTFTWSSDTLLYNNSRQTLMWDIWKDSSKKVYSVGICDFAAHGVAYQYDYKTWSEVKILNDIPSTTFDLRAIQGFSNSNIYVVGEEYFSTLIEPISITDSSLILHFDGNNWKRIILPQRGRLLTNIFADNSNDIWVGGIAGSCFHFDGNKWIRIETAESLSITSISYDKQKTLYASAYSKYGRFILRMSNLKWMIVDSNSNTGPFTFGEKIQLIGQSIYSVGDKLYRYELNSWSSIKTSSYGFTSLSGPAEGDLFLVGNKGQIFYYDGKVWYECAQLNSSNIRNVKVLYDGTEVFIIGWMNSGSTVIYHGK